MKMPMQAVLIATVSLLLSGCTHYVWMKQGGGDPASFPQDNFACKQTALNSAPPVYETYGAYPYYPTTRAVTDCVDRGPREVCRTRFVSQDYVSPPMTVDLNSHTRNDMYNACMQAHGWALQPVEE